MKRESFIKNKKAQGCSVQSSKLLSIFTKRSTRVHQNPLSILLKPKRSIRPLSFLSKNLLLKPKVSQETMSIPFGLIFSLILIVVFLVVAFVAVKYFFSLSDCTGIGQFYSNFQSKIDEAWSTGTSSFSFKPNLPSKITKICILNNTAEITNRADYGEMRNFEPTATVYLLPQGNACQMPSKTIKHLDIAKITAKQNPKCFDSKLKLTIKKDFYDKYVSLEQ